MVAELPCVTEGVFPGDGLDNDCDGRIDEEIKNFLDDDGDGLTDEDLAYRPPKIHVAAVETIKGCGLPTAPQGSPNVTRDPRCGVVTVRHEDVGRDDSCPREFQRLWNVADECGNIVRLKQIIRVRQGDPPKLIAPPNMSATCDSYLDTSAMGTAVVIGGCEGTSNLTAEFIDTITGCTVLRTWTVSDSCGNEAPSVVQAIAIQLDAPAVDGPSDVSLTCPDRLDPQFTGRPVISERSVCDTHTAVPLGLVNYTDSTKAKSTCRTSILRTWHVSDVCGNSVLTTQIINVADPGLPVVEFPLDATAVCSDIVRPSVTGRPIVTGNCSEIYVTHEDQTQGCYLERRWTIETMCGDDHLTHTQIVGLDYEPFPIGPFDDIVLPCEDEGSIPVSEQPNHRLECSGLVVTGLIVNHTDSARMEEQCQTVIRRQAVASDSCDNFRVFSYSVTYEDNTPPSLVVPPDRNSSCAQALRVAETDSAVASDSCNTVTVLYEDRVEGSVLFRSWQAMDDCDNRSPSVTQKIVLKEGNVLVDFPKDAVVPCNGSILPETTGFPLLVRNLSRDCYDLGVKKPVVRYTDQVNGSECPFMVIRKWTISTVFGDFVEMIQRIEVGK